MEQEAGCVCSRALRMHSRHALDRQRQKGPSGREAKAAALHTDLQAICRLATGVDDAAVHVTGQVTVAALLRHTTAAETRVVARAGAAGGAVQHDVAQG